MGSLVMGRAHLHTMKVEYPRRGGNEGERRAIWWKKNKAFGARIKFVPLGLPSKWWWEATPKW